jgi:apolipoprotein N-acyltransferase
MIFNFERIEQDLDWRKTIVWGLVAVVAFQLAFTFDQTGFLVAVYLAGLVELARGVTARRAFVSGLLVGIASYPPQLGFFWNLFGPAAITLWFILAFWLGLFVLMAHHVLALKRWWAIIVLLPILWTGLEFFRSELYYLRFSWLSAGFALSESSQIARFAALGLYGIGFGLMSCVVAIRLMPRRVRHAIGGAGLVMLAIGTNWPRSNSLDQRPQGNPLSVAGVQLEFPSDLAVMLALDRLIERFPQADLLVLSEYTFDGPVADRIKTWCRKHQRYLIVGGKELLPGNQFHDTVFVLDPRGEIVFQQGKSVPIQFFKDGLPATEWKLWNSPWGRIGICVCYDLSYAKVADRLLRLGAQGLIVPTMDLIEWGEREHRLHARVGSARAAEYRVPVVRVASSGISQIVEQSGRVIASAPFPGEEAQLFGKVFLPDQGRLPLDRRVAPLMTVIAGAFGGWLLIRSIMKRTKHIRNATENAAVLKAEGAASSQP